jgi:predicted amidophosphoribosyltransferase
MSTTHGQCAKCGDTMPYTAIVCAGCGSRLPWAQAAQTSKNIGNSNPPLRQPTNLLAHLGQITKPLSTNTTNTQPTSQGGARCLHCGNWNSLTDDICTHCGNALPVHSPQTPHYQRFSAQQGTVPTVHVNQAGGCASGVGQGFGAGIGCCCLFPFAIVFLLMILGGRGCAPDTSTQPVDQQPATTGFPR